MKKFTWGLFISSCLIALAWAFQFHPVCFVLLSFLISGILVENNLVFIFGNKKLKAQNHLLRNELDLKNNAIAENEALRARGATLEDNLEESVQLIENLQNEQDYLLKTLNEITSYNNSIKEKLTHQEEESATLAKAYADLLRELKDLEPDKKRGLFSRQHLFQLKETYAKELSEMGGAA